MKTYIVIFALFFSIGSWAGFGGSRGGGGFSSARSSSFGGSRASVSAPIIRSAAPVSRGSASVVNNTTVVHSNSGGRLGGNGFLTGMLVGHAMTNSNPVVVNAVPVDGSGGTTVVTQGSSFWSTFFTVLIICAIIVAIFVWAAI